MISHDNILRDIIIARSPLHPKLFLKDVKTGTVKIKKE